MKELLLMTFLFFSLLLTAQSTFVEGKVVDRANKGIYGVKLRVKEYPESRAESNVLGEFRIGVPADEPFNLEIVYDEERKNLTLEVAKGEVLDIGKVKLNITVYGEVDVTGARRRTDIESLPVIEYAYIPSPNASVERSLIYTTAATSNNELTNNYNVRGGSYDENLVYVNGFQIYRPFLTRTGEQEGMSFINPALVQSLSFSAGGFGARYGDRLSSVLDIQYRTPTRFRGSADASFLGASVHVEDKVSPRFNYMTAARYQDQSYILGSLPVQGAYRPRFYDLQLITNYNITENLVWSVLGHYSSNDFRFAPETRETTFGTINQALSFRVFFSGEEMTRFQTMTGATSLKWAPSDKLNLNVYASVFNTDERETFDVLGQYFINELETDPSKEEFGDSIATLGIGSFLNHARNRLFANIYQFRHEGDYSFLEATPDGLDYINNGTLRWGVSAQYETFDDVMSEWRMIDSAGYSIPQQPSDKIELFEVIKAENILETFRTSAFVQFERAFEKRTRDYPVTLKYRTRDENGKRQVIMVNDTLEEARSKFAFHSGVRGGYTAFNDEFYATPRAGLSYFPKAYYLSPDSTVKKRYKRYHVSAGTYYQPPFYRELRELNGPMNLDVLSQKSFHLVAGLDYSFEWLGREKPFKYSGELFYKYMWDVNPYQIDNVRTRYFATNNAVAYAYGMDMNLHGEFIEGVESFFKIGVLRTEEDILDDDFYIYFNSDGEQIFPGFTFNNTPVDSSLVSPGFIPRPTDQWFTFAMLFQDRMPTLEQFTAQLGLHFGSQLPFGPPDGNRYSDTLRQRSYFRVDVGFGYDLLYNRQDKSERAKWLRPFNDIRINFEVFNLLGINNVLSQQWVQDIQGRTYAIPNYLTFRRFNLKLIVRW